MRITLLVVVIGLFLSTLGNISLAVSRYYVRKADRTLLIHLRAAYKANGGRLPDDLERDFDSLSTEGFTDLKKMHVLSHELEKCAEGHNQH